MTVMKSRLFTLLPFGSDAHVKAAVEAYGRIDCFFTNAGIEGKLAPTAEYDEAVFDAVIGVNVRGVFPGLRHVLRGSGKAVAPW